MLDQIANGQRFVMVTADSAHYACAGHAAIAAREAADVIPLCKNVKPWKEHSAGAATLNDALRSWHRLGGIIWKEWNGYHLRSAVEAKMRCFKLLDERVISRDFDRQGAKLEIRAAILNRFTALATPLTQHAG